MCAFYHHLGEKEKAEKEYYEFDEEDYESSS